MFDSFVEEGGSVGSRVGKGSGNVVSGVCGGSVGSGGGIGEGGGQAAAHQVGRVREGCDGLGAGEQWCGVGEGGGGGGHEHGLGGGHQGGKGEL